MCFLLTTQAFRIPAMDRYESVIREKSNAFDVYFAQYRREVIPNLWVANHW